MRKFSLICGKVEGYFDKDGSSKTGFGRVNYDKIELYDGHFNDGHRNGYGRYIYDNGSYYVGFWQNGKRHGRGKCVYSNGSTKDGIWENNAFKR